MPTPTRTSRDRSSRWSRRKIGVMTHAFNYGTAVFEGIRGNWNADDQTIYLFRVREHLRAPRQELQDPACSTCTKPSTGSANSPSRSLERSGFNEDVYIRPLVYKSSEVVGVRLHNLETDTLIFITPFGPYLDIEKGARCHTSTWRRVNDTGIPPRAKVTGIYVNSALAKTEANLNGFDEAIMLNEDGHVSEGSGENIFMIRNGKLITPAHPTTSSKASPPRPSSSSRARLGIETVERTIDRTELYIADEVFMTGTAAHLTPVVEVDRRPVGDGLPGPITSQLSKLFFDVIRGKNEVPALVHARPRPRSSLRRRRLPAPRERSASSPGARSPRGRWPAPWSSVTLACGAEAEFKTFLAWALAAVLLSSPLVFANWTYCVSHALPTTSNDDALVIRWGFRRVIVPIDNIQRMVPGRTLDAPDVRRPQLVGLPRRRRRGEAPRLHALLSPPRRDRTNCST